ncbi:hypothetical protein R1sor_023854 [Riccia sorocarpa]|uniref:Protein kinase domain-containing protein n=1 Tax=Riccia sorocarpa TaxID=122646 RepID=A0ABD3GNU8_9MARC
MATRGFLRIVSAVLVFSLLVLNVLPKGAFAATRAEDVTALNALLREWSSGNPSLNLNWVGDPCLGSWTGIACDPSNTTVIALNLDGYNLRGRLLPDVGGLTNLQTLELSANDGLTGDLPKELGNLLNLQTLSLQWCNFTGPLPEELGNLVQLTFLGVNGNELTGQVPRTIGNLKNVTWFDLSINKFSGPLPVSTDPASNGVGLDNMTAVMHFHFNNNSLSGSIPGEIFSLPNLIHLIFDHNQFSGSVPAETGNSKSLQIIRFDFNQLTDVMPTELTTVTTLTDVNLRGNQLSGAIPDFSPLINLQSLDLGDNLFDPYVFPTWVLNGSLTQLMTLYLRNTSLIGELPNKVFALPAINTLDLESNQINGSLDFSGSVSGTLTTVILDNNQISGFVGQPLLSSGAATDVNISLYDNPICKNRYIQPKLAGCGQYEQERYQPATNGSCKNQCGSKTLNPRSCVCANPLQLNLMLTAPSMAFFTTEDAEVLENELAGNITSASTSIDKVSLKPDQVYIQNAFTTTDMRISLTILVFPESGSLSLSQEERSAIVHIIRQHKFVISYGPYNLPEDLFRVGSGHGVTLSKLAIVFIALGGALGFLLCLGFAAYAVRERRSIMRAMDPFADWAEGTESKNGRRPELKRARPFSLSELKEATNDWSEVLGEGGYGTVYIGTLKNGELVAIKRANKDSMQGLNEFRNELELLSRVHHRNLVDLVGFCYKSKEQCLVYEFMSNGTLRERLYENVDTPLAWETRLDIIINAARGLAYLHDHASPPIIHGDIKSANILLNQKLLAKVADFGLGKATAIDGEKVLYSDEIKGTRGYLDPEYFQTHIHTDKSDVFSYGVVMVEALTGRSPTYGGKDRTREIRNAFNAEGLAGVRPLMDPSIRDTVPEPDLYLYLILALRCTEEFGEGRPTMTEVVKELESLTGGFTGVSSGTVSVRVDGKNRSPEYSDTASLVNTSMSTSSENAKDGEGNAFHYSGAYGGTTTLQPK